MEDIHFETTMKKRLLAGLHSFLHISGLDSAYATFSGKNGGVIFMYHSVAENPDAQWIDPRNRLSPETFRAHMAYLARHRHVVSMDELVDSLSSGFALPRGSVVITLDDGYRDNLTVAAPILAEFNLPATLYLATGYVSREENQWIDQLYSIFTRRSHDSLRVPGGSETVRLDEIRLSSAAYKSVASMLLPLSYEERKAVLIHISEQLRPSCTPPRMTLSWDEVRELKDRFPLMAIGGHTSNHIDLSSSTAEVAEVEVRLCSRAISDTLGYSPTHFSFPYNRKCSGAGDILARNGFVSAVATGSEILITPGASPYSLSRIEAPCNMARLGFYSSGAYPGLSKVITGRE